MGSTGQSFEPGESANLTLILLSSSHRRARYKRSVRSDRRITNCKGRGPITVAYNRLLTHSQSKRDGYARSLFNTGRPITRLPLLPGIHRPPGQKLTVSCPIWQTAEDVVIPRRRNGRWRTVRKSDHDSRKFQHR